MQIERHVMPDGSEEIRKKLIEAATVPRLRTKLATAYRAAIKQETCVEVKQTILEPDDLCPCGSRRKAKNCCAGRLVKRLAAQREMAEVTKAEK